MKQKRRWSVLPSRITNELNGISGIAGVGGTAIGIASWTALAGTTGTLLMTGGITVAVAALGYAVYRAIPPCYDKPEDLVGRSLDLNSLDNVFPPIRKLAIVGPSRAGKTTLKNRLCFRARQDQRTQSITAQVVPISNVPRGFIAILDGGGEQYAQQFKICEKADCICIVLDHSQTSNMHEVDAERIRVQQDFLQQIRYHLASSGGSTKKWIRLLVNKRDLWEKASNHQTVRDFANDELTEWKKGRYAQETEVLFHSNESGDDVAQFMAILEETVKS